LSDKQAISYYTKLINVGNIVINADILPATFTIYIFQLDKGVTLPGNIHISRDNKWTEDEFPTGHHSINASYGGMNGMDFVEKLSKIEFDSIWTLKVEYPVGRMGGNLVCRRMATAADGTEYDGVDYDNQWEYVLNPQ
jgi:hypothetical protein